VELTPRTGPTARRRSMWPKVAIVAVVVALGAVAFQGINHAAVYFHNADEAVAMRDELGDRRFRLQGTVVAGSIERTPGGASFAVAYNGVRVRVRHQGSTPEMFQPGIPVVLEGSWSDTSPAFDSDRILVKHSEEYEADHGDRLDDADDGQDPPPRAAGYEQ
jgi:cytochrome c-type biogenesis protein CcmE